MSWLTAKVKEWEATDDPAWLRAQLDTLAGEYKAAEADNARLRKALKEAEDFILKYAFNPDDYVDTQLMATITAALSSTTPHKEVKDDWVGYRTSACGHYKEDPCVTFSDGEPKGQCECGWPEREHAKTY
jgi:hypothetical protein